MAVKTNKKNFDFQRIAPILIIILPLVAYFSAVRLGLTYFDDDMLLMDNLNKLSHLSNIPKAFLSDAFFAGLSPYYRPMMNVSFIFDTLIGQGNIGFYHFMNLFYHILACGLLYNFLLRLNFHVPVSLSATLIFSLHPVIGHAVLWIPARGDLLVTVFTLASFLFLDKYTEKKKLSILLLHLLAFAGAVFSKESSVVLPILYISFLIWKKSNPFQSKYIPVIISWLLVGLTWYLLRFISIDHRPDSQRGIDAIFRNMPFIPESVSRLLFPVALPVTPIFSPVITFTGLTGILLIVFLYLFFRKTNNIIPVLFGSLWFLAFCLPNMFVRLASADDNFEYLLHRLYLPSVGFLIMMTGVIPHAGKQLENIKGTISVAILLLLMLISDYHQQSFYKNGPSFWTASTTYAPGRSWFFYYYGRYYFKQKDFATYEKYLLKADSIKSYPNFHYQLAMVNFTEKKDYDQAFRYFNSALSSKDFGDSEARKNYVLFCIESSNDLAKKGKLSEAIERCQIAVTNDPENEIACYNLGLYVIGNGQKERAVSLWRKALEIKSDFKDPYKSLAIYYLYDRKLPDSAMIFAKKYKDLGGNDDLISLIRSKQ